MQSVTSNAVSGIYDELKWKNRVFSSDTRRDNNNPQWYMQNYTRGLAIEFKTISAINTPALGGTFCILFTCILWSDSSGGLPMQFAVGNGKIAKRTAISTTNWGSWVTLH